jgi:hypothetical protein
MPKPKKYWGVEPNRNRHGRPRWYFRPDKKVPRIRLPDTYGSAEFKAAWRAAMAGQPLPLLGGERRAPRRRASRGSLGWAISLYLDSEDFKAFRPATQRPRRSMLEGLAREKGTTDLEDIDKTAIQASVNARRATPHMANVFLGVLNGLFQWATRECLADPLTGEAKPILEASPCDGVKRLSIPKSLNLDEETGHPTFTDHDLAHFEASYLEGTMERKVYATFLYTGFRVGDGARVGRQHVQRDGTIKIKTEKTNRGLHRDRPALTAGAGRRTARAPGGAQLPHHVARQGVGQKLSRLVVRRAVPRDRARPFGARLKESLGAPLRRAGRDRAATDGDLRLENPIHRHALRGDGEPEEDGARRAGRHGLGRNRETGFPSPPFPVGETASKSERKQWVRFSSRVFFRIGTFQ